MVVLIALIYLVIIYLKSTIQGGCDVIVSERLVLKALTPKEVVPFYQNHRETSLKHWMPNEVYQNLTEAARAIEFFSSCVHQKELPYVLGIFCKEKQIVIGDIGVNIVDGTSDEIEIGYSVCEAYCGRGYATEAVQAMIEFVLEELKITKLQGRVLKGNLGSQRVLEKNGFTFMREEASSDDPYGQGMLVYIHV